MHIRHFGTHSWGSELFEKQKDILFQIKLLFSSSPCLSWQSHSKSQHFWIHRQDLASKAWPTYLGSWPLLTHQYRRRPCGVTESGGAKKLENLAMIQASVKGSEMRKMSGTHEEGRLKSFLVFFLSFVDLVLIVFLTSSLVFLGTGDIAVLCARGGQV